MQGFIYHFVKWQIHSFISIGNIYFYTNWSSPWASSPGVEGTLSFQRRLLAGIRVAREPQALGSILRGHLSPPGGLLGGGLSRRGRLRLGMNLGLLTPLGLGVDLGWLPPLWLGVNLGWLTTLWLGLNLGLLAPLWLGVSLGWLAPLWLGLNLGRLAPLRRHVGLPLTASVTPLLPPPSPLALHDGDLPANPQAIPVTAYPLYSLLRSLPLIHGAPNPWTSLSDPLRGTDGDTARRRGSTRKSHTHARSYRANKAGWRLA